MKLFIFVSFLVVSAFGHAGENKSKPCHLNLVSVNEHPVSSPKSSSEDEQYLAFLADMKLYGISFKNPLDPEQVERDFDKISKLNLERMLHSYTVWMKVFYNDIPVRNVRYGYDFVLWKNLSSPSEGLGFPRLLSDKKVLSSKSKQRPVSLWSKVNGGFHGVPLNMEYTALSSEEVARRSGNGEIPNGTARVVLREDTNLKWAYSLPFVGVRDLDYVGLDQRFFAFLGVYSPELFGHFFLQHRFFFDEKMSLGDLGTDEFKTSLNSFLAYERMGDLLRNWTPMFKHLILNYEDAQYLVAFMAGQKQGLNLLENLLTIMVPGDIGPADYLVNDNPHKPKKLSSGGSGFTRQGPVLSLSKPNMTGDTPPFPPGPQTK